ncbi:4Fe-4S dicluster domain-containing protein [Anaeroselena agilis]|uniref:4Fe-4S dicluster domain-containing protein n=1 Tax=Anaeroselena agilis TaxID=3063788 RepID=A0ABU3P207_9FIRM|nr:4Fe-4S dicluster domain-containing protein [Selenomonadales bacterium 4137-cl]
MTGAGITPSRKFIEEVETRSAQPVSLCYQCKKCAGGCPMSFAMKPYNCDLLKLIKLGEKEAVLRSNTIWLCVGCKTCGARCPNGIDISKINDTLREMALACGIKAGEPRTAAFHASFLATVKTFGRSYEAGTIGLFKLKTASYAQDLGLGLKFLAKNKLKLLPDSIKRAGEIKRIFRKAKEAGQ